MLNKLTKSLLVAGVRLRTSGWKPYSHLIIAGDNAGWVLDWEMRELRKISKNLGVNTVSRNWNHSATPQSIFLAGQFFLAGEEWLSIPHRIGFSYFHGFPNSGEKLFDSVYDGLCKHHERIDRIQVSYSEMRDLVLQSGISSEKVHLIPIGINLELFHYQDSKLRKAQRKRLEIPENSFVVGSFQKDGNGWGEGLEPKLIKGPDIFIETMEQLKSKIPELFVLLTGPARGYVKSGLERLGIPYRHIFLKNYPEIGRQFSAIDLYLVTSRQEGGPKAILESMAAGTPLVTTRVGQAMDIVRHGQNGWMVDVEDVEGLAKWAYHVYQTPRAELEQVLIQGRTTAEQHTYANQISLWHNFMDGFVEMVN